MSEIDWSKAPEGFPLWIEFKTDNHRIHSGWYRKDGNYFKGYYGAHWPIYRTGQFFNVHYKSEKQLINDAYLAPISPSPAWSGEGLPPVGVRCEAAIPHTSGPDNERSFIWIEGCVIAYYEIKGKTYAWFAEDDGFYPPNALEFRPIRTPEQIAKDERLHEIRNALTAINSKVRFPSDVVRGNILAAAVEAMIDAGYRKVDQPK